VDRIPPVVPIFTAKYPSHKAKLVKDHVQSCRGKLELHFLPPYAPDLNPDEFVWQLFSCQRRGALLSFAAL
jgi:transposase